ncbi:MAG: hypothetical protein SFZ23_00275 [Planctomycetota bacterium]|nr:hypothetical protein [Planctomycetota bacterium]
MQSASPGTPGVSGFPGTPESLPSAQAQSPGPVAVREPERSPSSPLPLVASAVLVLALALTQVGRLLESGRMTPEQAAHAFAPVPGVSDARAAGMVSSIGDYTVMTTTTSNEDLLVVLDGRSEDMYVYRVDGSNQMQLVQRLNISQAFAEARARSMGK